MLINKSVEMFEKFIIFEKNLSPNTVKAYKNEDVYKRQTQYRLQA